MAFPSAGGYGNLPNGVFSPVIYSKQVQLAFRKSSVIEAVTNNDYFGEIANFGDSVRIIKEPEITVTTYARGTAVSAQNLIDTDYTLVVDQANYFAFKVDDIEAAHSHVNWMSLSTDRAGYRLRDTYDNDVLKYMSGYTTANAVRTTFPGTKADSGAGSDELLAANKLFRESFGNLTSASTLGSIPLAPRLPGATAISSSTVSPMMLIARMARRLDQQNVDSNGRWLVVDPIFVEMLKDEDSRLLNADFGGSGLQNGLVLNNVHGFKLFVSNNLPSVGTGAGTAGSAEQATDFGVIVAGHESAVATAEQITKTESYRDVDSFADIVRGMHLYGRKILRPEALVTARYNVA